jgi:aldehyde dehydrogenase
MNFELVTSFPLDDSLGYVEVRNPANTDEVVGLYPKIGPAAVDLAVNAALNAQPSWSALSASQRAEILVATAVDLDAVTSELEELLVREQGKVRWEATFELAFFEATTAVLADLAHHLDEPEVVVDDGMGRITMHHEPFGVVGIITPWNYPFAIPAIKVLPALLAGNAVVLVVSPSAPLTSLVGYRILAARLPDGLLTVLTGEGPSVGQRLVEHPDVSKISFTGSTATGRTIARTASSRLKSVVLELGGNDAAVVLDDCELDEGLFENLVTGAFMTTGQVCFAIKRLYVPSGSVDRVAEGIESVLNTFVIGNGLDDGTSMGPLHCRSQRDKVVELVADAKAEGGQVRECGTLAGDPEKGWFLLPSIVTGLDNKARLVQEEQFGPSLPILGYDTLDEAIALANDTEFGLCSSVWTSDEDRGARTARRLEAGTTFVNSHGLFSIDARAPFGGVKQSGIGRELGLPGLLAFCEPHVISTRHL